MQDELDKITRMGASARAASSTWRNPFIRREYMPAATGDTQEVWRRKFEAWETGWRQADEAMRLDMPADKQAKPPASRVAHDATKDTPPAHTHNDATGQSSIAPWPSFNRIEIDKK
jgi:hypothetical protein